MSKFLRNFLVSSVLLFNTSLSAQQVSNSNFEDWSAPAYDGQPQPKGWNASNVSQVGMEFNFAHKETGHNGGYCLMVQDQDVGAMGITETSPGYFSLGQPWAYLPSIMEINKATAGTYGGISWKYRPDSLSVWIKRTGPNTDKEDFYLLYYAWTGTAKGDKYKGKNGQCTSYSATNEESDIRLALNGNECGTTQKATQICEGMWREKKTYGSWTNIRVPIYYMNNNVPTMMNLIFSASNYPNFRANDGLYKDNSLYVDDIELIYSATIQKLYVGGKEWKGFDPSTEEVQTYALGETATEIPSIEATRGAGSITNAHGTTVPFPGRTLSGSEVTIVNGDLVSTPTRITVKSEDGKKTMVYKIQFVKAKSSNSKLAGITINGEPMVGFSPAKYNYPNVSLPYGTTAVPVVGAEGQEDDQTISITQPTSPTGNATIVVTAANGEAKSTYNLTFSVAELADNTLQNILVNGSPIPGFTPSQTIYKVSLPVGTTEMPTIQAVSAYAEGEQTIVHTAPSVIDGGTYQISVTTKGNPVAKVYKLNFKLEASSYIYLNDLQMEGGWIHNFQPTQMTYYVNLPLGTTELPEITYEKGDQFQSVEVVPAGLDGTTRVIVTAGNGDQAVYKIVVSTEKSENSMLQGIKIGGQAIADFRADSTSYTWTLSVGTTELPTIEPIPGDEYQSINITPGGVNGKTRITVTAGNGSTTIYVIAFSVQTYTDNTLKGIYLNGTLIEGFKPETNEYTVNLPQGTTALPAVTYELQSTEFQTVSVRTISGLSGDYKITVRPQSGASRTYIIHFTLATSSNVALAMIYIDGEELEGFAPDKTDYEITLPAGVSTIPNVTYLKSENSQRVLSVLEDKTQIITVTAESGDKREYRVTFVIQVSKNAYLEMIYLDGVELEGFDKEELNYTVELKSATCPLITVAKAAGQQVTITAPYAVGTAYILVQPEQGASNTYRIEFVAAAAESAQLKNIFVDGNALEGFQPATLHYTQQYAGALPEVTWEKGAADQTVSLLWKGEVAWIHVVDAMGNKAAYSITFSRQLSGDKRLRAILLDGTPLASFDPTILNYDSTLVAGSSYPQVGYIAEDNTQIVFFGQLEDGKWGISVAAEDGTSQTYTIAFSILPYNDVNLVNLEVVGHSIAFDPEEENYSITIDEGAVLPDVIATAKEGQTVVSYVVDENHQQVVVTAESGATKTYNINYTRVQSGNALLADILIEGESLYRFRPDSFNYSITLPKGTAVVPNIYPIAQLDNQTITTYFSRPNGTTLIEVEAQDGTKAQYTIAFPVEQSANTKLAELMINGDMKDVNETDFTYTLPYGTTDPYEVSYTKAEATQTVDYISAPVTGVTKLIVHAENGDTRTYSIRYSIATPQGANVITKVDYSYVNMAGETQTGSLVPEIGDNIINLPFGAKAFAVDSVYKNYKEQTVIFYNGGIRRGAKIIAAANRESVEDVVYTITPKMPEFDTTGKLKELKFNGALVPNWRPDVYNYMINVTAQPTIANFTYVAYDGKTVTPSSLDAKKKQVTFAVDGGETYSVCWYYSNDDPQFDFSKDWVKAAQGPGYKPTASWKVPADYANKHEYNIDFIVHVNLIYQTGKEVIKAGVNGALLSTLRGAPLNGSVPGMMTTGNMTLSLANSGGSSSSMSMSKTTGVVFRNTPEQFTLDYNPLTTTNITKWYYDILLTDGTSTKTTHYDGSYNSLNTWQVATSTLDYSGLGNVQRMTFAINSAHTANANDLGSGATGQSMYESQLLIQDLRFVYNSALTAATVNGATTTKSGNTFTYNLAANEDIVGIPSLKFTGAVHDQMQTIEWLNDGEWINGELRAKVTNYGENSLDNTVYTVVLHRDPVTSLEYTASFGTYPMTASGDTTFVNLPFATQAVPDMTITPASVHQNFAITKVGKNIKVVVTAEDGSSATTVYAFRETKSNNAALASITAKDAKGTNIELTPAFDANTLEYSVEAEQMPIFSFAKQRSLDDKELGQIAELKYNATGATITVTAADGTTQRVYTINRTMAEVITSGKVDEFSIGTNIYTKLGKETYECTDKKPTEAVFVKRQYANDSIVFVQSQTKMEWQVYGSENHTYVYNYPTEKSNNARLSDILAGGKSIEGFDPEYGEYTITSDTTVLIEMIAAEPEQSLTITQNQIEGGVEYQAVVTAADGNTQKTYTVKVVRPLSNDATLAGLFLDGALVNGFRADSMNYVVTISASAVKIAQPKMPSVTYLAGHEGQTIEVEPGLLGETTTIEVNSEDRNNKNYYYLKVEAEPSHCVDLTGITVNGEVIEHFESGRHFYSVSLKTREVVIDYAADDRFLTVTQHGEEVRPDQYYIYTLHVMAEDNITTSDYQIEIFVENQSSDNKLKNITLDGKDFVDFERALNPTLTYDEGNNNYTIILPAGTTTLPEVSAQLKMNGQNVVIEQKEDSVLLHVTAVDGTPNTYTLHFVVPMSKNADLSMIFLDGNPLEGFTPDYYFYQVTLPEGVHSLPDVAAQKGESSQTILPIEMDYNKLQATIKVQAEDTTTRLSTYVVVFHYSQSNADTLMMIYADGVGLEKFAPHTFYYNDSLAVGTQVFPDLSWEEKDQWQIITMDTVLANDNSMIRQIHVTAESGKKSTYTVSYTIRQSAIDTLQMIYIDQRALPGFNAEQTEYSYTLSAAQASGLSGLTPEVEYIAGDEYQTISVSQATDSLSGKSLGYKSVITVTAATGATRTYTIHYPVELSTDATLNMIMLGGKPISNYDAERFNYKVEIDMEASIPVVSVVKKEDAQTYEIRVLEDTVLVVVFAENIEYTQTYTLAFDRQKSSITTLRDIIITDDSGETLPTAIFAFRSKDYEYTINIPYNAEDEEPIPAIETILEDPQQSVERTETVLPNGDIQVSLFVTAPNGEDQAEYSLTFHFVKNNDATLKAIYLNEVLLPGFDSKVTEYDYVWPYGSTSDDFFDVDAITYLLSDELAVGKVWVDESGVIFIQVIAQDGETELNYVIRQIIGKDNDCSLITILLGEDSLRGFDPDVTFYTYYLIEGNNPPVVDALPHSENAEVSIREVSAGDTCTIICTAADGTERRYYIYFAVSTLDDALIPTANDVILRRVPGSMQLFAGTIRKDVTLALYDQNGHLLYYNQVPVSDPNDADVSCGADGKDHLNNVVDTRSGLLIDIVPGQVYFYTFFVAEKDKITSGKILALP